MSKKYFDRPLPVFCLGQAIKTSPKSMKTVLQCAKCVFRPLKWSKFAIEGTLRASPVQENPNLKSKNYFNKSLSTFCRCQATKTSPEIMIIVLQGTKRVFWGPRTIYVSIQSFFDNFQAFFLLKLEQKSYFFIFFRLV